MGNSGKLYAYTGTMGAGKSKKLCALYNKLSGEGKNVIVFKHVNDAKRGGLRDKVVSRNGDSAPAISIESLSEILMYGSDETFDAVLIDEIQFFNDDFTLDIIEGALIVGVDVHVFGLDISSDFNSFGLMGDILARADEVKKLRSKCRKCGAPARVSAYIGSEKKGGEVKVGDIGDYAPTCRNCFYEFNPEEDAAEEAVAEDPIEDDTFLEINIKVEGGELGLGVYESDLASAGYTESQVRDINSVIGIMNLLKDLGLEGHRHE